MHIHPPVNTKCTRWSMTDPRRVWFHWEQGSQQFTRARVFLALALCREGLFWYYSKRSPDVHESEKCLQFAPRSPYCPPDVLYVLLNIHQGVRDKHVHCRAHHRSHHLCCHLVYRFTDYSVKAKSRLKRLSFIVNPGILSGQTVSTMLMFDREWPTESRDVPLELSTYGNHIPASEAVPLPITVYAAQEWGHKQMLANGLRLVHHTQ